MQNTVLSAFNNLTTPLDSCYYDLHSEDEKTESQIVKFVPSAVGPAGINSQVCRSWPLHSPYGDRYIGGNPPSHGWGCCTGG